VEERAGAPAGAGATGGGDLDAVELRGAAKAEAERSGQNYRCRRAQLLALTRHAADR
jgi:hypothetical protein